MSEFSLEVKTRKVKEQSKLTADRSQALVPGVIYGFTTKPISISMTYNALLKILKEAGTSNIIDLKLDNKIIKVIVREYQQNPVTDKLTHVDFMAIDDKRLLTTVVPLEFVGASKAVKEQGAKVNIKNDKVKVQCLAADLPAKFTIDVSVLSSIGQTMSIGDIKTDDKVTILNNPKDPVMNVTIPKKIKEDVVEEVPSEGEEAVEGAEAVEGEEAVEGAEAKEGAKEGDPPAGGKAGEKK